MWQFVILATFSSTGDVKIEHYFNLCNSSLPSSSPHQFVVREIAYWFLSPGSAGLRAPQWLTATTSDLAVIRFHGPGIGIVRRSSEYHARAIVCEPRSAPFGGGRIERRDMVGEEERERRELRWGEEEEEWKKRAMVAWWGKKRREIRVWGLGEKEIVHRERDNNKKKFDNCFMGCQIWPPRARDVIHVEMTPPLEKSLGCQKLPFLCHVDFDNSIGVALIGFI